MKKFSGSMLLAAATVLVSTAYAGGDDTLTMPAQNQNPVLFATAEGGYTWNSLGDTQITVGGTTFTATQTDSGGSGRLAMGAVHYSTRTPGLSYTGELGWGYYGKTEYAESDRGIDAQDYIYGVDLLAGVDYMFNSKFDGFFKLGGLFENVRMKRTTDLSELTGGTASGTDNETTTTSSVIPEVKIGGIYNVTSEWGLSAAYVHAFGNSDVSMTIQKTADPDVSNTTATGAPVSLNTILFGVVYRFA